MRSEATSHGFRSQWRRLWPATEHLSALATLVGIGVAGFLILAARFTLWRLQAWAWVIGVVHTALIVVRDVPHQML